MAKKKRNDKKYNVKDISSKKAICYWEDVIKINNDAKKLVTNVGNQIKTLIEKYKDVVDTDENIAKQVIGASKIIKAISDDLVELEKTHKDKNGNFFKGKIDENEKEIELYITLVLGYDNFITKISNIMDNMLITFSGELAESSSKIVKKQAKETK